MNNTNVLTLQLYLQKYLTPRLTCSPGLVDFPVKVDYLRAGGQQCGHLRTWNDSRLSPERIFFRPAGLLLFGISALIALAGGILMSVRIKPAKEVRYF